MSIPYWREKEYTDDGCSVFECLNCYCTWESRTAPWHEYEGERSYKVKWRMCPVCGCLWVGKKASEKVKEYPYYNNERLELCLFKIVEVYTDTSGATIYQTKTNRSRRISNPKEAIRILKDLREQEKDSDKTMHFDGVEITYHIEKDN